MRFDPEARRAARPALSYDEALPVNVRRLEIGDAIGKHQVVVICGEIMTIDGGSSLINSG